MNAVEVAEPTHAESLAVQCVASALKDPIATQRESLVHKPAVKALKVGLPFPSSLLPPPHSFPGPRRLPLRAASMTPSTGSWRS